MHQGIAIDLKNNLESDLETWIYMSVELYASLILPWRRVIDKAAVLAEK
uniref:Uncharacterized protein n=1 Tax=Ascaris lumbricoides TaxID=6252 RepID=A0A0M3HK39_ASCLU